MTARRSPTRGGPLPWWGSGAAPLELWPGVTIDIPARWSKARARWESPDGRYYFDAAAADLAAAFFPTFLTHHIGEWAGQPFELLEYQVKLLTRPLFGWKHAEGDLRDRRRFRKVFGFFPKGAGKSPWGSGTGIYLARCDHEPAAEVYAVAADTDQGRIVHDNARIMVEASDDLMENCEVLRDSIYWDDDKSFYKVLSSVASTKHGFRPHGVILDEMHAQKNRKLYEALWRSMKKRRQPVMIMLSHAGDDDEGICHEEYEYAKNVLSGSIHDEECLPVIFEMTPKDDWTDPAIWRRVNPGHGITVQHSAVASECLEAQNEPRKLNDFLMFTGNRWVNQATAWIPVDWWDACKDPMPSDEVLRAATCAAGIDMAQKIDLAAGVVVFRLPLEQAAKPLPDVELVAESPEGQIVTHKHRLNYRIAIVPQFWLPEDTIRERSKTDGLRYDEWVRLKYLTPTDGAVIDSDAIVNYFKRDDGLPDLVTRFPLLKQAQFGYDPAFATEIALDLRDVHGLTVVEVLQNYKHLSEACQVLEALIKAGRVIHGGHPVLRNHLENVAIKRDDAGRIRPVKPKKATKRIDGIVAVLIALTRLMVTPEMRVKKRRSASVWTPGGWKPVVETPADQGETTRP